MGLQLSYEIGEYMNRKNLLQRLKQAGFTLKEGGEHTKVYDNDKLITTVPRHKEVNEITAKQILRAASLHRS